MSSSFSQSLNSITLTKLREVSKQLSDFTSHREIVLTSLNVASSSRERVQILLDGISAWRSVGVNSDESSSDTGDYLVNVEKFLIQAERDPSIGEASLRAWEADFRTYLDTEKAKHEYAELFGRLLREWIASPTSVPEKTAGVSDEGEMSLISADDTFERVGRKEMHEQRAMFESLVFTAKQTDTAAIVAYLDDLFSSKPAKEMLESVREGIKSFGEDMLRSTKLTVRDLELAIASLLVADLLSNEKCDTLKEFTQNPSVLAEVTDVLNMHLASLTSWSWIPDGGADDAIPVEMRRQLNGKYRVFMDEEILQAIFLHWIGLKWATEFKHRFKSFFESRAWKLPTKPLSKVENERREYFLGEDPRVSICGKGQPQTIDAKRRADHMRLFFMNQLPESLEKGAVSYDAEDVGAKPGETTAMGIKQSLLHILTTECLLNTTLHNEFTVVRSDFAWFGPSLPHSSIITALRFFGVPEDWLIFFQTFLRAPLKFVSDGPSAAPQIRKRGIPMSHTLGDCFGEVLLFCMDYAVNQKADGLFLYRIHDDFWFWNRDSTVCAKAWQAMSTFTRLVGLEFNYEKTGSVSVGRPLHPDLPKGNIKWGFLKFEESGQFVIDQAQVDVHIDELKLQLKACEHSVFAWVQAYNKYVASFFVNNFGSPPAQCFGQRHVDMVIDTLQRIHLALFPEHGGSVIRYLAHVIQQRFGVSDIPPGWFLWPMTMGGLEVKSPLIPQFAIRDYLCDDPVQKIKDAVEEEEDTYTKLQEEWNSGTTTKPNTSNRSLVIADFLPYEEYALHREQRLTAWKDVYAELLQVPQDYEIAQGISGPSYLRTELHNLPSDFDVAGVQSIHSNWFAMNSYWRWVVACYGKGVVKKWGGLEVVRPGSLPLGMAELWKSRKMRWEQ
ncbi:hypothetical protein KC19_1G316800 [Ceratodon purpureus]|uniref:Reverse transcriptase domain-containing protein n=1 Tax=Ceratodon purpureus TaxID=3225 RepID=A0A8T0JE31_CERPU|nr:hypothetical protein KC19_1G316800 [Ceratodon purpureus]